MDLDIIIEHAKRNAPSTDVAKSLHMSKATFHRTMCRYGVKYKTLVYFFMYPQLISAIKEGNTSSSITDKYDFSDISANYHYIKKVIGKSYSDLLNELGGNDIMTTEQLNKEQNEMLRVITTLSTATKNMTLKEFGVDRTDKNLCMSWINNLRVARFGLAPNFVL